MSDAMQTPDVELFDPARSWVLSAGAGSGKTYRLVRRYLRAVESEYDREPDGAAQRVLAVTFTKAAAAEMRHRIFGALSGDEEVREGDDVLAAARAWPRTKRDAILAQIAEAPIATIHGFCQSFLGEFPERTGVAPGVRPIEPEEDELLRATFLSAFVDAAIARDDEELRALLREHSIDKVRAMVEDAITAEDLPSGFATADGVTQARAAFPLRKIREKASETEEQLERLEATHAERIARIVRFGLAARHAYTRHLEDLGLMRYADLERRAHEALKESCTNEADPMRAWLAGRFAHVLVDEFQDTNGVQKAIVDALVELSSASGRSAARTFLVGDPKQSIYRFRGADVGVFTRAIDEADERARGNLTQTHRPEPNLASAFNASLPWLFGEALPGEPSAEATLPLGPGDVPWTAPIEPSRTEPSVLGSTPLTLLLKLVEKEAKDHDQDARDAEEDADGDDGNTSESTRVAQWLKEYLDANKGAVIGKRGEREEPLSPKHVAVLLPRWRDAERFRRALASRGIPATIEGGRGLHDLPAVRDLANLARLLADPEDPIAATGVLRGALGGVSDLGLYALARGEGVSFGKDSPWPRLSKRARSLAWALRRGVLDPGAAAGALLAGGHCTEESHARIVERLTADARALATLQARLGALLPRAGSTPTASLLEEAIAVFHLHAAWAAEEEPARATANAWRFVARVRALEAGGPNPRAVAAWIEGGAAATPEGNIDADSNVVTITTVHGAKGLQWPVVILASVQASGTSDAAALGLTRVPIPNGEGTALVPTAKVPTGGLAVDADPRGDAVKKAAKPLDRAERRRLLYVGMTRACDRLVLSGDLAIGKGLTKEKAEKEPQEEAEKAAKQAGLAEYGWRSRDACGTMGQLIVSMLRLAPREDESAWVPPAQTNAAVLAHLTATNVKELESRAELEDASARNTVLPAPPTIAFVSAPAIASRAVASPSAAKTGETPAFTVAASGAFKVTIPEAPPGFAQEGERWEALLGEVLHAAAEWWGGREGQRPTAADLDRLLRAKVDVPPGFDVTWLEAAIDALAGSGLGKEMSEAASRGALFHELPIEVPLPPMSRDNEHRLVSGRIDALFQDAEGRWVVVDYKLTKLEAAAAIKEYAAQLALYRESLEAAGLSPVARLGLWLARTGEAVWLA
jgi:ATP-dependent exoDNAse (exonuclease V) beta subunit